MGRRYYRRYRRRSSSSPESLGALVFILLIGALGQVNIKTVIFYSIVIIGAAITAYFLYYRYKSRIILESGIDIIDTMEGTKFEEVLLLHFQKQGYKGHLTPATNDYGADLVIEKDGQKTVVQAKRWKQIVGIEAVQQVIGAIKHYNAAGGMVITNSTFTQQARNLALSNNIELWDRKTLIKFLRSSNGQGVAERIFDIEAEGEEAAVTKPTGNLCPACGKTLVLRSGRHGKFMGCSGFPTCRFTKELQS